MKKPISITLDEDVLKYIDDLCDINYCKRSFMIEYLLRKAKEQDLYGKDSEIII